MPLETRTGTLTHIERLPSSRNGNPRYQFVLGGKIYRTRVDSSFGYSITNYSEGDILTIGVRTIRGYETAVYGERQPKEQVEPCAAN